MSDETNTEETKAEEAQAQEATAVEIKDGSRDDEIKTSEGVKDRLKFFFSDFVKMWKLKRKEKRSTRWKASAGNQKQVHSNIGSPF